MARADILYIFSFICTYLPIEDIVHILSLTLTLSALLKIKLQINILTRLNVVFSIKQMFILIMKFPPDIDQLACKKNLGSCNIILNRRTIRKLGQDSEAVTIDN